MTRSIGLTTLLVRDYDEALAFFVRALRFQVREDVSLGPDKRWLVVGPEQAHGAALLLAKASTPEQQALVGNQAAGRVFLFLETGDFYDDHRHMLAQGVKFMEAPRQETYGTVAVFFDLYGNKWDLLQRGD